MTFPARTRTSMLILFTLSLVLLSACMPPYQNEYFSYQPPPGVKINTLILDGQPKLSFKSGSLYFSVSQQEIPDGSSLQEIYRAHRIENESRMSSYQFISETALDFSGTPAIEYIYRGFSGEPYVQRRELWLEKDGWVYQLLCSDPVDATPGLEIPVHEKCYELAEEFRFKE